MAETTSGIEGHRFAFLCGLHRSGTTLVAKALGSHPAISGFDNTGAPKDEGQHLQEVYPNDRVHGGPGIFGLRRGSYLDEHSPLATAENGARLFAQWSRHWDLTAPLLLEKTPSHINKTRLLQHWFPDSSFIVVLRHPLASGYATRRFTRAPIHKFIENWLRCYERFEQDLPQLRRACVYKYEDFVRHPQETMSGIYRFLGVADVPLPCSVEGEVNERYFAIWRAKDSSWLQRKYRDWCIERFEARCNHFGYSLVDLARNDPYLPAHDPVHL